MKLFSLSSLAILYIFLSPVNCDAAELTTNTLQGKWIFTHILVDDGTREMKVNRLMEFFPDGSVINYDASGAERSRASFKITGNRIIYTGTNDRQKWNVMSFEDNELHVEQNGAEMFFKRQ